MKNENLQIKTDALKLLAKILRYSPKSQKDEIIKYCETELVNTKNFYLKRQYFIFFEECLDLFSFTNLREKKIIDHLFKIINENNTIILNKFLKIIPRLYIYSTDDSKLKNVINSKIEYCRKYLNKDALTVENIIKFDKWHENFLKNYDIEENKKLLNLDKLKYDQELKSLAKESPNINYTNVNIHI